MQTTNFKSNLLIVSLLLAVTYVALALVIPHYGMDFDSYCWQSWAAGIYERGLGKAYSLNLDYNPFLLYFFYIMGKVLGSKAAITEHIVFCTKLFTLAFDFLAVYITARFLANRNLAVWPVVFLVVNLAYLYNTIFWGQVDSIHSTLTFISVLLLFNRKLIPGMLFFILALNMKTQAIIYVPFIALAMLPLLTIKSFTKVVIYALAFQLIILLPFIINGDFIQVIKVNGRHLYFVPVVSANAYNLWYMFFNNPWGVSDKQTFAGIAYKYWGLFLFFTSSFLSLFPILVHNIERRAQDIAFYKLLFLSMGLVPLIFFYFNTEMHERYIHPAILFSGVYAILASDYIIYMLLSIAYVLNLEKVLKFHKLDYSLFIFNERLISGLFLLAFIIGMYRLYGYYRITGKDLKRVFTLKTYYNYFRENLALNSNSK